MKKDKTNECEIVHIIFNASDLDRRSPAARPL